MEKCKYPNEACANMKFFNGNTYCDSVPCVLKEELPKPSNADKIRAMSDEELAEFINFGSPDCSRHCADFKPGCSFSCNHNHGNDVILKWLQSEAE